MASMGTALPAAVGACSSGAKKVFVIAGDGGFLAGSSELSTIAEKSLPVKIVVFNNGGLQFIREIQKMEIGKEVDMSFGPVDLASVAEAFGIKSATVRDDKELTPVLKASLRDSGPLVIDVRQEEREVDIEGTQWDKKIRS